jgi:hypothetical protein
MVVGLVGSIARDKMLEVQGPLLFQILVAVAAIPISEAVTLGVVVTVTAVSKAVGMTSGKGPQAVNKITSNKRRMEMYVFTAGTLIRVLIMATKCE